jgi:hypothetical protein
MASDIRRIAIVTEATLTQMKQNTLGIAACVRIPGHRVPLDLLAAQTGTRFQTSWSSIDEPEKAVSIEAAIQGFKRNSAGVAVTLKLHPDDTPPELFTTAGSSRWLIAWIQLGDADEPVEGEIASAGRRAESSARGLVRHPDFQSWCSRTYGVSADEEGATQAVLESCGVEGLDEISMNHRATRLLEEVREEFVKDWNRS